MSMFRSKKLDLGCFVNIKVIRDHTKRKVFAANEPERYAAPPLDVDVAYDSLNRMPLGLLNAIDHDENMLTAPRLTDRLCDTSSAT